MMADASAESSEVGPLVDAQPACVTDEILAAAEACRHASDDHHVVVHGWHLSWVLRRKVPGGDFVGIDPADGKRVYSLRALRVKLGVGTVADLEAEDAQARARLQKRQSEEEGLLLPEGVTRKRGRPISYVEQPKRRVGDTIVLELDKAGAIASAAAVASAPGADAGCAGAGSTSDGGTSGGGTSGDGQHGGIDVLHLAERLMHIGALGSNGHQTIRAPLQKLLASGRVRRRLVLGR